MKASVLCLAFFWTSLFAGSVTVYNDSPFPLTATIISADGQTKGTVTVEPQHQSTWQEPSQGTPVWSETPYTVIFTCKTGKQFGVVSNIGQGSLVTAMQSSGNLYCEPEKKDGQQGTQQAAPPQQPLPSEQHDLDLGPP